MMTLNEFKRNPACEGGHVSRRNYKIGTRDIPWGEAGERLKAAVESEIFEVCVNDR